MQSSLMACWISSSVVHFIGSHSICSSSVMYFSVLRASLCPKIFFTCKKLCPDSLYSLVAFSSAKVIELYLFEFGHVVFFCKVVSCMSITCA